MEYHKVAEKIAKSLGFPRSHFFLEQYRSLLIGILLKITEACTACIRI